MITIYTFDGTASPGAAIGHGETATSVPDGSEFSNFFNTAVNSGGFPATVAKRLIDEYEDSWDWYPVEYLPHRLLTRGNPMSAAHDRAVSDVTQHILSHSNDVVLVGYGQGSIPAASLYNEFRSGNLQSRRTRLLAVVNFGDMRRPLAASIAYSGVSIPPGNGVLNFSTFTQSYGQVESLVADPETLYWSLSQVDDPASTAAGRVGQLSSLIAKRLMYSTGSVLSGFSNSGFRGALGSIVQNILDTTTFTRFDMDLALPSVLTWLGYPGSSGVFLPGPDITVARVLDNRHVSYADPYTPLYENPGDKSAVDIAFEYLLSLSTVKTNTTVSVSQPKPVFFYPAAKTRLFQDLGLPFTEPSPFSYYVAGLNGNNFLWQGGVEYDPFPDLLDSSLWTVQRVSYPSAIGLVASIKQGVEATAARIASMPSNTPFALGGWGQGGGVAHRVYEQVLNGYLADRRHQLRAVVTFGSPVREVNHSYGSWSGSFDVFGSSTGGHGVLDPQIVGSESLAFDFVMPTDVFSACGDGQVGSWFSELAADVGERPLQAAADRVAGRVSGKLDQVLAASGTASWTDPYTGQSKTSPAGGSFLYAFKPPPNSDGVIPSSGDTCYQVAAKYLNRVGAQIKSQMYPQPPPMISAGNYTWFSSLPGG